MLYVFLCCAVFPAPEKCSALLPVTSTLSTFTWARLRLALSFLLWTVSFLYFQNKNSVSHWLRKAFPGCLISSIYSCISFASDVESSHSLLTFCALCVPQKYEQELFKLALPCLSAVAGALPPDYMESNYVNMMEKQSSMDSDGNFNPQPVDTSK